MKSQTILILLALPSGVVLASSAVRPATNPAFEVHEWGTFTTVSGSDGGLLPGLEREEHALPNFVHSLAGFSPADKGWSRPVTNVTVKMETPVIYFYARQPLQVGIEVGFHGGSISQWYPDRVRGEVLPNPPIIGNNPVAARAYPPLDFARGYEGAAAWSVEVLAPHASEPFSPPTDWETPQWPRARVAAANRVRASNGEVEGFIFYRGIGRLELPLEIQASSGGALTLRNLKQPRVPFVLVYEKPAGTAVARIWWKGTLAEGGQQTVQRQEIANSNDTSSFDGGLKEFAAALETAGLSAEETTALLATWRESYFDRAGLRVFWIVPRAYTDEVLPMTLTPQPEKLARVLVGRSEVLTPEFEAELAQGFAANGGKAWENDRYFLAYRERARQLGVVSPPPAP